MCPAGRAPRRPAPVGDDRSTAGSRAMPPRGTAPSPASHGTGYCRLPAAAYTDRGPGVTAVRWWVLRIVSPAITGACVAVLLVRAAQSVTLLPGAVLVGGVLGLAAGLLTTRRAPWLALPWLGAALTSVSLAVAIAYGRAHALFGLGLLLLYLVALLPWDRGL